MSKEILRTERLILREMDPDLDAQNFFDLNNDPEVLRYTGDLPFESVNAAHKFIQEYIKLYQEPGFARWMIIRIEDGRFLGFCGLKKHPDGMIDLGFRLLKDQWGKGYASEAALACVDYGFDKLDLHEIIGRAASENLGSIRILEKCGMTYWKMDTCDGIPNSRFYRIEKSQHQKQKSS